MKKTFRFYFTKKQKELAGRLAGERLDNWGDIVGLL